MNQDPLLPISPARVKALLLPLGQITIDKFSSYVERLYGEHVVRLRDITPDVRPNRNMFSPLAYPDGAMIYDFITHVPPPSHLALSPFDLFREPLAVIALADGAELQDPLFSKRHSASGRGPTVVEKNIRALSQELEDLRDNFPKALVHQVIIFDYKPPSGSEIPMPEGIVPLPPLNEGNPTATKTALCDVSSLLLAEMTTLARSFEAMTVIESPGSFPSARHSNSPSWDMGTPNGTSRRNSQFSLPGGRSNSDSSFIEKARSRMSMPPAPSRSDITSSSSTPARRPSTPTRGGLANQALGSDGVSSDPNSGPTSPDQKHFRPDTFEGSRDVARDRVSVQGFGPGGANDRWRLKGKGRSSVVIGSMYLQVGRWSDSLKELSEGATAARSLNDHIWHGKALELILVNLLLLGRFKLTFQIPAVLMLAQERPASFLGSKGDLDTIAQQEGQPKHVRNLENILPDLLDKILSLYTRISAEHLPPLALSETTIRFCKILSALHFCEGKLNETSLAMIVSGVLPEQQLTTSPRPHISPSRQLIITSLFKAFPSATDELLTTADRVSILSGIASVLGPLGFQRKKAMVIRELVSVLIGGLVEARTRGAAEAGVHPAAGLVSLAQAGEQTSGTLALDLGEGDIEHGIEAFLELLCKSYGIIGFDNKGAISPDAPHAHDDSDAAVVARIYSQAPARFFGFNSIKLNILRACINFSEALPDFNGVLKYSSDLMRTAGSGLAPGPRREDATPIIHKDEQVRLVTNIARTSGLVERLGMSNLSAEYWDEFLIRGIKLEPLPYTRTPIPHARSVLPGATASRSSQDVNPFIYNPFLKELEEVPAENLVAGELAIFRITLQNTYDVEVEIESIRLDGEGAAFEAIPESTVIGPYRTQLLKLKAQLKEPGAIKITGAVVKVRGCRERRFSVFSKPWSPAREEKIKLKGIPVLSRSNQQSLLNRTPPETESLSLNVIQSQPLVVVKSTTLPQSSVMILEGERQVFSVTLRNLSATAVDFMLFSFKDSTQEPLQTALTNRDATPAELYEYELIVMKKQALRLPRSEQGRYIGPGEDATFAFEILGKPGLTHATIQVDYTHLGVPRDEITEQFFTRQLSIDLTVTVNASVELARIDALPMQGHMPQPLWERLGGTDVADADEYCLLSMDMRNAWPSHMVVRIEGDKGMTVDESILPGKTSRLVIPIKRVYLEDPHASIPSLNPSRTRQFVVSTSKISPEMERTNRESFWYRERILDSLKATWRTTSVPKRQGTVELRNMRLTPRMIEAVKIDEVDIKVSVSDESGEEMAESDVAYVDRFMQMKVHIANRTTQPIYPIVRVLPALCHRPLSVALDYTRKFAWNGTLQQLLPELKGKSSTDFTIGVTALCRGNFEVTASVEEVQVWEDSKADKEMQGRPRSDTQKAMDAALGLRERRIWHSRTPLMLTVKDAE